MRGLLGSFLNVMELDKNEKLAMLKRLFWDYKVDPREALDIIEGKRERVGGIQRKELFVKILNMYPWHKVRQLIPESLLPEVLQEDVIMGLFPKNLRDKYRYVRSLL